jgi:nucleoside-diphosphate-sugar epimerase
VGKAKRVLGWQPEVSFDAGLPKLIEWFKAEAAA